VVSSLSSACGDDLVGDVDYLGDEVRKLLIMGETCLYDCGRYVIVLVVVVGQKCFMVDEE
jgi:hypothetical protein